MQNTAGFNLCIAYIIHTLRNAIFEFIYLFKPQFNYCAQTLYFVEFVVLRIKKFLPLLFMGWLILVEKYNG